MQFAIQGITFRTDIPGCKADDVCAMDENGLSCWFQITEFCYSVSPVNAIRAARAFLNERDELDSICTTRQDARREDGVAS